MRVCVFFFFKQKTAYEMRISDWSSDVCSSDLGADFLRSEIQHDIAGQMQHVSAGEIHEHQACLRVEPEVAERVEVQVAGEVRNGQPVAADPDEARLAAALGRVDRALALLPLFGMAADEENIGRLDHLLCLPVQVLPGFAFALPGLPGGPAALPV